MSGSKNQIISFLLFNEGKISGMKIHGIKMLRQFCSLSTHRALLDSMHLLVQILIFALRNSLLEPGQLQDAWKTSAAPVLHSWPSGKQEL